MTRADVSWVPSKEAGICQDCGQDIHVGDPVAILEVGQFHRNRPAPAVIMHRDCAQALGDDMGNYRS